MAGLNLRHKVTVATIRLDSRRYTVAVVLYSSTYTGWFEFKDGNVLPGQNPRLFFSFFESGREKHVFYEPLRTPDLTGGACVCFVPNFSFIFDIVFEGEALFPELLT